MQSLRGIIFFSFLDLLPETSPPGTALGPCPATRLRESRASSAPRQEILRSLRLLRMTHERRIEAIPSRNVIPSVSEKPALDFDRGISLGLATGLKTEASAPCTSSICSSRPSRARRPPGPSSAPGQQGLHSSPPWRAFPAISCRYATPPRLTGTASALQSPRPEASKMDLHALPALQRPFRPCLVSTVYGSSIKSRMTLDLLA